MPGMTVPILLGEDFHVTYEIGVKRELEFGTTVSFGGTALTARAVGVQRTGDYKRLRGSAYAIASFVKAKTHRRNKTKRAAKKRAAARAEALLTAVEDVKIPAHSCKLVRVEGDWKAEGKEWLVEKGLFGKDEQNYLAVPNVLITNATPWIPVTNTSNAPRRIAKGSSIAALVDPARSPADMPSTSSMINTSFFLLESTS